MKSANNWHLDDMYVKTIRTPNQKRKEWRRVCMCVCRCACGCALCPDSVTASWNKLNLSKANKFNFNEGCCLTSTSNVCAKNRPAIWINVRHESVVQKWKADPDGTKDERWKKVTREFANECVHHISSTKDGQTVTNWQWFAFESRCVRWQEENECDGLKFNLI